MSNLDFFVVIYNVLKGLHVCAGQGGLLKKSRATTMGATYSSLAFHLSRLKNDPIRSFVLSSSPFSPIPSQSHFWGPFYDRRGTPVWVPFGRDRAGAGRREAFLCMSERERGNSRAAKACAEYGDV